MNSESIKLNSLYYPPGGILIWMVVFIELITFMIALTAFVVQRNGDIQLFQDSQQLLNKNFGVINTLFLVTAGFFMANALYKLKQGDNPNSAKKIKVAILFGVLFLGLKGYEYVEKINHGIGLEFSEFFTYYWLLTGFHFIHVLVGLVILGVLLIHVQKGTYSDDYHEDVETGAIFWHMCDLIWLILFPILYLL